MTSLGRPSPGFSRFHDRTRSATIKNAPPMERKGHSRDIAKTRSGFLYLSPAYGDYVTRLPGATTEVEVVVWNMTKAQHAGPIASWNMVGSPALGQGEWIFTPASVECAPTLHCADRQIELRYSSSVLGDFLTAIGQIQANFHRLWNAAHHPSPAGHGDEGTGRSAHV
ncbi:hypothetical protein [Streptomyces sp. NPDC059909]|uniref:hypothetical protein n=1 Tax=Streptomyces sp. NPDC059909 TaxID=3346998 RepID=UPI003667602B